jgi:hypothetical protein
MSAATDASEPIAPPRPGILSRLMREPGAAISLIMVVLLIGAAVFAPLLAPTDPYDNDLALSMAPPGT